ncbi:MAG TPA: plastocyanin/azurin family copper-binding protein [Microthrixaceae bacterium]|nr:plastocyanin/azurin family copper-binding protein [Microthrixaceae bacterium]
MQTKSRMLVVGIVALSAIGLGGCSSSGSDGASKATTPGAAGAGELSATVKVVDNAFEPKTIELKNGGTVTWQWEGKETHDVKGDDFMSPEQAQGTFKHTFDKNGTFHYVCTIHAEMKGLIKVS